jgi:hypothetical protein
VIPSFTVISIAAVAIDKRFTEEQKQKLLDHHGKALMIAN